MEPLAVRICCSPLIKGLPIADMEEQVSLYTDDTLVHLANTRDTLKALLSEIGTYGDFSGFRVSRDKSNLFPLDPVYNVGDLGL